MGAPTSDASSSSPLVLACRELLPHPSGCWQRLQLFCSCLPPQGHACVGSYRATKAAEGGKPCLEGRFSSLRQAFKEELRFPAPRWAFITSHAPRTIGLARASMTSSRTRPAPSPSKYFLPFLKRDQETTCKRLHITEKCHDVRRLLDAMLAGSRPSFIPASGQAPSRAQVSKFRCQSFPSCPKTTRRISEVSPPS